jgi:quercetin 2,3-dioxygenase
LLLKAGNAGTRFVLYAGKPQGEKFVSQGPFIGDTGEDIKKVYSLYIQKKLQHIADAPGEQRLDW